MKIVVTVADMKCGRQSDVIVTHALGSCLGLVIYDPVVRVGGMLHAMLPLSRINPQKAVQNPFMFVDTGVPALFQAVCELGGIKSRMSIKAAGCGKPLAKNESMKIGQRNHAVLKKLLWKNKLLLDNYDLGGNNSRTLHLDLADGRVWILSKGDQKEL